MKRIFGSSLFFALIPLLGFGFSFQFHNTDPAISYRVFSASLQNLEQSEGIRNASFEQAYEAFLRPKDVDSEHNQISLTGEYHYSQRIFHSKEAFQTMDRDKIYHSYFSRDARGVLKSFSPEDYYPSIRSIPVFPEEDVPVGGRWVNPGNEFQDFSLLGYRKPFQVPFIAEYQYVGDIQVGKKEIQALLSRYRRYDFHIQEELSKILSQPLAQEDSLTIAVIHVIYKVHYLAKDYPAQTAQMEEANGNPVTSAQGGYDGIVFWDKGAQEEKWNIGEYNFFYEWKNLEKRHWSGREYGIVDILKRDETKIEKLAEKVREVDKTLEVEQQKRGVKVILGDLLFHFNKISLRPQVEKTLSHIVQILSENSRAAIHITGYSDDIGTSKIKEDIANGRARTVASFLVKHGIESSRISYAGNGDRNPRVPNTNSRNRQKNRRVEMDIITE